MKSKEVIEELKSLSISEELYTKKKIKYWLVKYQLAYKELLKSIEKLSIETSNPYVRNLSALEEESKFLDTYEVLLKVYEFFGNELYFKEELNKYDLIKNNINELRSWLENHKLEGKKRSSEFVTLFQNIKTLTGYELTILYPLSLPVKIKIDPFEFQYTLKFLNILERSSKTQIIGKVKIIKELEVREVKNSRPYRKKSIVVSIDDTHLSELLITFVHDKVMLLNSLKVGMEIKVFTEIRGGENESEESGYSVLLIGWDFELIN